VEVAARCWQSLRIVPRGGAGSAGAPEGPSWWLMWQIRLPSATVVGWEPVVFRAINTLAANGDPGLGAEDRLALVARRERARRFVDPASGSCQAARQTLSTAELPPRRPPRRPQRGLGGHGQRSRDGRDRVPARRARRSGSTSTGTRQGEVVSNAFGENWVRVSAHSQGGPAGVTDRGKRLSGETVLAVSRPGKRRHRPQAGCVCSTPTVPRSSEPEPRWWARPPESPYPLGDVSLVVGCADR